MLTAGAVVVASLGIALGTTGTAAAQDPAGKYPTKAQCLAAGYAYMMSGHAENYDCSGPHAGAASKKWWLYLI